ncbi:MAG: methyltransferase domain-containing protein [Acidobacteria bacterium]|nr:methyltransferase domain-containing protein [Acidobacteriota bacterium]
MKTESLAQNVQKKFDFPPPNQRPFLSTLPAKIDSYEEGVARYFQWRTGLDYYLTIDQIVDFVVNTGRVKVLDLLTDTATFTLRLAARKAFVGRIYSFDNNITLLERAKQRAVHLSLQQFIEFKHFQESRIPVADGYGELAVSIFDLHRHHAEPYLAEAIRILSPNGHLVLAELLIPKAVKNSLRWLLKNLHLKYVQKNPTEARAIYYDQEEIIALLFKSGFRQVIIQGLHVPASRHSGVFSLIAATK